LREFLFNLTSGRPKRSNQAQQGKDGADEDLLLAGFLCTCFISIETAAAQDTGDVWKKPLPDQRVIRCVRKCID